MEEDAPPSAEDTVGRRTFVAAGGRAAAVLGAMGVSAYAGAARCETSAPPIRLGVVGGNFGAQFFFHEHPGCRVVAVTDLLADRRAGLQRAYRCETSYASYEQMLERATDELDAVALFTPAPDHVNHVAMAAARGLDVLCACPAATTLDDCHRLKEIVESSGIAYMQAETSWYRPQTLLARDLYRKGAFGELYYTEAEYHHDRGDLAALEQDKASRFWNPDGTPSWRRGYPPLGYCTHATAFLVGVSGERITKVSALGWGSPHSFLERNAYENPFWNASSLMQTNHGHVLRCNVFWLVAPEGERGQWFGDRGALFAASDWHGDVWHGRMAGAQKAAVPEYWRSESLPEPLRHPSHHGNSATFITAEFIDALLQKRTPEIDVYHSLAMIAPGLVGHASALKEGEQMSVPQFDPQPGLAQ